MNGSQHKYYLLGERVPIRVTLDSRGLKMAAEVPSAQTGLLTIDNRYLSRIDQSPEVEEIEESEFQRRCDNVLQRTVG